MAVFCRAAQRRRNIEQRRAPDGRLAVSSLGLTIEGVDDINAQISQVHDDLIADKGLAFTYDPHIESGDCRCPAKDRDVPFAVPSDATALS
jgi:hypothetical protein